MRAHARLLALAGLILLIPALALATPVTFRFQSDQSSVYLAGEFNGWSTSANPMSDEDGDGIFELTLELEPGRYMYKFVVNGTNWTEDPHASETADDGFGGKNAVVQVAESPVAVGYGGTAVGTAAGAAVAKAKKVVSAVSGTKESITFRCEAPGAVSVFLAGEFNDWSDSAQPMNDVNGDGVFETAIPLEAGRYAYKFVVDGNWQEDPSAAEFVDDGFGGKNSVIVVGGGSGPVAPTSLGQKKVRFVYEAPGANSVHVAGEFNGWSTSDNPMADPDGDGVWETILVLDPGRYMYKFVVNGSNWHEDPHSAEYSDDGYGGKNSVVNVGGGEGIIDAGAKGSSTEAAAPMETGATDEAVTGSRSVTFRYQPLISGVGEVFLAGTFNDWNAGATKMTDDDGNGTYEVTLLLAPGEYQYKFVADGTWITDENADDFTDDGFGGQNSIIRVDSRYAEIEVEKGDGEFYLADMAVRLDYATLNDLGDGHVQMQTKTYLDDVEGVTLLWRQSDGEIHRVPMEAAVDDAVFTTWQSFIQPTDPDSGYRFTFALRDGDAHKYATAAGEWVDDEPRPEDWVLYTRELLPPFSIPLWAQKGVFYQIFADRFANGDPSNDQTFTEPYYEGRNTLPASGKTNGEYFHFESDWNNVAPLQRSPYRTDGKPDYYSFYGGDIAGIHAKIPYLVDLGVTIIYFNPITDARSNHRYDPCDYLSLDPHLASEDEFRAFTKECLDNGIRVIVDMAYNHTGDCHFAFQDVIANWTASEYYDWYEWKKKPPSYPLPAGHNAIDYYDCWWGFGLHPNLNFDLSRENQQENGIRDIEQARPNEAVVAYVLDSVNYWLGDLGCSGFRLDVPNEVPFWFWKLFRERCREVKPDHLLIGEIWGDAGNWITPDVFDAVMNYRYFKDPVVKWIAQKQGNAAVFDKELAPGRTRYPIQAVRAQMNLVDSHDTIRFLQVAGGDVRRLRLAATFAMSYVGAPHIYYGDEMALTGGKDPDCRRTMPWDQMDAPARKETLEHYRTVGQLRKQLPALSLGDFTTVLAKGDLFAFVRKYEGQTLLVVLNNGEAAARAVVPVGNAGVADGASVLVHLGDEDGLAGEADGLAVSRGVLPLTLGPVSGVILELGGN